MKKKATGRGFVFPFPNAFSITDTQNLYSVKNLLSKLYFIFAKTDRSIYPNSPFKTVWSLKGRRQTEGKDVLTLISAETDH